jgi:hypothetical protein
MNGIAATGIYSITSSATASMVGGTVSPSILAVFTLRTSSKLVACSVDKSCGRDPLRIRSVSRAIWRKIPGRAIRKQATSLNGFAERMDGRQVFSAENATIRS